MLVLSCMAKLRANEKSLSGILEYWTGLVLQIIQCEAG